MTPKKTRYNSEGLLEIFCSKCQQWKLSIDFWNRKVEKRTGKVSYCINCGVEMNKEKWKIYINRMHSKHLSANGRTLGLKPDRKKTRTFNG